ncbi:hypothetical protein FRC12_013149 [Ceratobasidium sp. 428]|nr:hypothetical protein FRC12_013149 [Ceratobasidium sp. 428]
MARRILSVAQAAGHEPHIHVPPSVAPPNASPPHTPPAAPPVALPDVEPAPSPLLASLFGLTDVIARGSDE